MSGGTMIALAADEIVIVENAVLGPIDPQIGQYPAASLIEVVEQKPIEQVKDNTLVLVDIARKALKQLTELLKDKMDLSKVQELAHVLSSGLWTHDYPITIEKLKGFELPVRVGLPREVYTLMELYPQPSQRRPSVQYIPMPYESRGNTNGRS